MTRYHVNINSAAVELLGDASRIILRPYAGNTKLPGAKTMLRPSSDTDQGVSLYHRDRRASTKITEALARETGLRARQRYTLKRQGRNSFVLVPHSRIGNGKPRKFDEPMVTVTRSNT
jgi:hypothetical protein